MAEGGFNFVLDRDKLVARHKVIPGDAEKSRLYRRVHRGEMPPEEEAVRPSTDDIVVLRQWVEAQRQIRLWIKPCA